MDLACAGTSSAVIELLLVPATAASSSTAHVRASGVQVAVHCKYKCSQGGGAF